MAISVWEDLCIHSWGQFQCLLAFFDSFHFNYLLILTSSHLCVGQSWRRGEPCSSWFLFLWSPQTPRDPLLEQLRGRLDNIHFWFCNKILECWWGCAYSPPEWSMSSQGDHVLFGKLQFLDSYEGDDH